MISPRQQLVQGAAAIAASLLVVGTMAFALERHGSLPSPPLPTVTAPVPPSTPAASAASSRNLFLAPPQVRSARGQGPQDAPMGLPPAGVPGAVPSMLPPPMPTGLMPPPPPLPGVPGIPALPGAPSLPAGMMLPAPRGQPKVVARPEVLGVLVGDDPQAILAHGDLVVVARVGERTPWGVIVGVRPGAVVLRTAAGTIVIPVHLDGVR